MPWNLSPDALVEAIAATEASIAHHRKDVLQKLEQGQAVSTTVIVGGECALCNVYYGEAVAHGVDDDNPCAACPLFQTGYGCDEGGPWAALYSCLAILRKDPSQLPTASAASYAMVAALEETLASLRAALPTSYPSRG